MGFTEVASIAVICLVIVQLCKLIPVMKSEALPVIAAICGGILGAVGMATGIAGLAELDIFAAIATGIVSGLGSSGFYDLISGFISVFNKTSTELDESDTTAE